jgi:hypothetical protein
MARNETVVTIEAKDEEKKESRHHDNSFIMTTVPTGVPLNPSKEQEIDLRQMKEQDLESLKKNGE